MNLLNRMRRNSTYRNRFSFLYTTFALLIITWCQFVIVSNARGQKIQLYPLSQHVDSAVINKLKSVLPTVSARFWAQLQLVKREIKSDLRVIRILLEEHAGLDKIQAAGKDSITAPITGGEHQCTSKQSNSSEQFERNISETVQKLEILLTEGLVTVSENCVREIEENNQMVFDQQRAMIRSLDQIEKKIERISLSTSAPEKSLPFSPRNQVQ